MPLGPDLAENTTRPKAPKACRHCPPLTRSGPDKKDAAVGVGMPSGESITQEIGGRAPEGMAPGDFKIARNGYT